MFKQLIRLVHSHSCKPRSHTPRRSDLRVEALEERCTPSATTALAGDTLTITIDAADQVNIAANSAGNFTVTDSTNPTVLGLGSGPIANVNNITVDITATGAVLSAKDDLAQPAPPPNFTALTGNFTVTDTQPNNAISVNISRGFSVAGALSISNTGAGSTFQETLAVYGGPSQIVTGVFLDLNTRGSFGSVNITGSGTVGFDGVNVLGNATVTLGNSPDSSFFSDGESIYNQDPGRRFTLFNQNPTTIGGDLTVTGGADTEVYNTNVTGDVSINETSPAGARSGVVLGNDTVAGAGVVLGNVTIGKDLTISTPPGTGTNGVFVDFSRVGGATSISEDSGKNVIGLQSNVFHGTTALTQSAGAPVDAIFIDSATDLQNTANAFPGGLPTDAGYIAALSGAGVLPPDSGSTFGGTVTSTQGSGVYQLEISQDQSAATVFTTPSTFTAASGTTIDVQATPGVVFTLLGGAGPNVLNFDARVQPIGAVTGGIAGVAGGIAVKGSLAVQYADIQTLNLNNASGVETISGPDTADRPTAFTGLNTQERFVQALYLDELSRAGAKAELDFWVGVMNAPGGSQTIVAGAILRSQEARDHLVKSWYVTFLGRQANGGEEQGWVNLLVQGQTEKQVLSRILGSTEFNSRAQTLISTGTAQQRDVQALYLLLLNRTGGAIEVTGWVNQMPQVGPQGVAQAILTSTEFRGDQFEGYYNALLHRPSDAAGLANWVFSNLDAASVRIAFESSPEFFTNG